MLPAMPATPRLLTRQQAARMLNVSTSTVDRLVARGTLEATRLPGRLVRFTMRQVMRCIESSRA